MTMTGADTRALSARQETYRCLAVLFCEPDVDELRGQRLGATLRSSVDTWAPSIAAPARLVEMALDAADPLELRREHARLFLGPGRVPAPPYGTLYLDGKHRLMGASTERALRAYSEAGLELDSDAYEAPDHIAIELEFLQYLDWQIASADAAETIRLMTERRRKFLDELVAPWVPALCTAIRDAVPGPFHAALADCLLAVVSHDVAHPE